MSVITSTKMSEYPLWMIQSGKW